jgi:hypothetical protein
MTLTHGGRRESTSTGRFSRIELENTVNEAGTYCQKAINAGIAVVMALPSARRHTSPALLEAGNGELGWSPTGLRLDEG